MPSKTTVVPKGHMMASHDLIVFPNTYTFTRNVLPVVVGDVPAGSETRETISSSTFSASVRERAHTGCAGVLTSHEQREQACAGSNKCLEFRFRSELTDVDLYT
ncbi:hypothetical protein BRADI_2g17675v3 [Brachypodium distachyon]|uniref:Uncharacterized protein n=1 Tax=Brachypodium distachyon TaxID=15368 RepID=A0A2K2D914_BRADI|nr:hypothetical protein BRADI_2g17675v3 [Brachypodium distachyon]